MGFRINSLYTNRERYYKIIDDWAEKNADKLFQDKNPTSNILKQISALYYGAKAELPSKDDNFEAAYHSPVTGDFEFLIARTLYYYSIIAKNNWRVLLRRQKKQNGKLLVPDIRIVNGDKTIGIIELKIRVGWMQSFFSTKAYENALNRHNAYPNKNKDPEDSITTASGQLKKYIEGFHCEKMFVLIPTLKAAHRKKNGDEIDDFRKNFEKHSNLSSNKLILLTEDLTYDPEDSVKGDPVHYKSPDPESITEDIVNMVKELAK